MGGAIMGRPSATLLTSKLAVSGRASAAAVLYSMGINRLMLAAPIYMLQVFGRVLAGRSMETLALLTRIALFAILTRAALEAVTNRILVKVSVWLGQRLGGALLAAGIEGALVEQAAAQRRGLGI